MITNKLFIVCPFSRMESFLRHKYGEDAYFLTFTGAVIQYDEPEYLLDIKNLIQREKIRTIYVVNDTSCRFINGIINKNKLFGLYAEEVIEDLYIEHYRTEFKGQSVPNQQSKLAELNIKNQLDELLNSYLLGPYLSKHAIEVKGLVTSKEKRLYKEISIQYAENNVYEL